MLRGRCVDGPGHWTAVVEGSVTTFRSTGGTALGTANALRARRRLISGRHLTDGLSDVADNRSPRRQPTGIIDALLDEMRKADQLWAARVDQVIVTPRAIPGSPALFRIEKQTRFSRDPFACPRPAFSPEIVFKIYLEIHPEDWCVVQQEVDRYERPGQAITPRPGSGPGSLVTHLFGIPVCFPART